MAGLSQNTFLMIRPERNSPTEELPEPRSGHKILVTENCVYSLGGYNPDFWHVENDESTIYPLFRELWKYCILTNKWAKLNATYDMPDTLASHAAVLHKNKLLMFGGTSVPFGETSSNEISVCDLDTLDWKVLQAEGNPPIPSYGVGACVLRNSLYIVGGTTGWQYNMDVRRYDLSTGLWESLEPNVDEARPETLPPPARYRHELATDGYRLMLLGGGRATEVYPLDQIPTFDLRSNEWTLLDTEPDPKHGFPEPRRCHASAQLHLDVYISGGYNGSDVFGDIWHINLRDLCWRKLAVPMREPAYFHSMGITPGGVIYIFGGVVRLEVQRTSQLYALPLSFPSLREKAWHAVLRGYPQIVNTPLEELLTCGIPHDLIARLT